jgi:acetyltransferase-like isoleucine patch superfamily enzyme
MQVLNINHLKHGLKHSDNPLVRSVFRILKSTRGMSLPAPKVITTPLYYAYCGTQSFLSTLMRLFWWTPLFKGRLKHIGSKLYLYGGLPYISGPVQIEIGENCRVSGQTTFSGRSCAPSPPRLIVGDNVDIGWMTTIAVGQKVVLGNNVRIAGRALLAGYPGHPLDPKARAAGLPETEEQVGNIVLEDNVWLATGVSVMAGVHIGCNTIVAAGSVVTHDLPANVLCGGIPAKVIYELDVMSDKHATDTDGVQ